MKHIFHSNQSLYGDRALARSAVEMAAEQRFVGRLIFGLAVLATAVILHSPAIEAQSLPWMNTALPPEQRAALLVGAMTLPQKEQQLVGNAPEIVPELPQCLGARHVRGIASLAIPTLRITNGPVGIGQNDCVDPSVMGFGAFTDPSSAKATALPSAIALAASFDPAVASQFGNVIGTEANNLRCTCSKRLASIWRASRSWDAISSTSARIPCSRARWRSRKSKPSRPRASSRWPSISQPMSRKRTA